MLETINSVIAAISDVLYQPWFVPLLLVVSGIYFTFRCRFIQIRLFKDACRVIMEKPESEGSISSFGALMISTASRVGTGNIIGVSTAICLGGPGAIFWMWVTALLGGATAFIESTLAQIYKKRAPDGSCYGGPAYYMRDALGKRWMGVIFSVLIILIYAVGYNMLAAYNLQSTFSVFKFYHPVITPAFIGVILAFLFGVMVLGGAKRLASITEILVPFMGILYVLVSLLIICLNIRNVPGMFASIFRNAFDFQSVMGGFSGRMGTSTVAVTSLVTSSVRAGAASSAGAAGVSVCDAAAVSGAGTSGWFSSAAADGARQSRAPSASESANILHFIALSPFHKNSYYYNMHGGDGMQAPPPFFGGVNKNRKNSLGRIANFELWVCCKITKRNLTRPEWPAGRLPGCQWA